MKSVGIGIGAGLVIVVLLVLSYWRSFYEQRFYPGVWIQDVNVSGLTPAEAQEQLSSYLQKQTGSTTDWKVTLTANDEAIASSSAELGLEPDLKSAIRMAWNIGRTEPWWKKPRTIWQLKRSPQHISISPRLNTTKVEQLIDHLDARVAVPAVEPTATLTQTNNPKAVRIDAGKVGHQINRQATLELLTTNPSYSNMSSEAVIASVGAQLSEDQLIAARERIEKIVGKKIEFRYQSTRLVAHDQQLVSLLAFPSGISESAVNKLLDNWEKLINRPPQEPVFEYDTNTLEVTKFVPPQDGLKLNRSQTTRQLAEILTSWETQSSTESAVTTELSVEVAKANQPLSKTNNLGINELIGFGESEYGHSIPSRIHNVGITTNRISLTIVKPGEEFSFNQALGDVSSETGFKPAYVIKGGMTVLGDGGGVCQVSSTLFRALLNAGLKITRRLPHSYRVTYYELNSDPGFDATVYSGNIDLRFLNDTGNHLLIYGEADSNRLYMKMEIYGTSDGRTAQILDYKKWDFRAPPPAQYFPDPSLAPGQTKQIDWSASGLRASFRYLVKDKDGNVKQDTTYTSNYQPWAAKYLQGI